MALEAVVYQQDLFGYSNGNRDPYSLIESWGWDFNLPKEQDHYSQDQEDQNGLLGYDSLENQAESCQYNEQEPQNQWDLSSSLMVPSLSSEWATPNSSSDNPTPMETLNPWAGAATSATTATSLTKPRQRRARSRKSKEEIENQRMTHIAVERNRRKQMNEYLTVLKSLMPDSYVQRGDQASIVGGAINFVKELEQNLHCLSALKMQMDHNSEPESGDAGGGFSSLPFGEFFTFPQYSTTADSSLGGAESEMKGEKSRVADVEVTMVESHANLKIRLKKRPKQLLYVVSGMQSLRLSILHLNVSTVDQFALYSLSVKVEDDSNLTSVDEIATAVHQLLGRIEEDARLS